ncbi:beta-ribofuranosylaminobenzene 5'-phosphate synthase [soil metagenome]
MSGFRIQTPSRLHFGLLSWGSESARRFGGVGLMIDRPGLEIEAHESSDWQAEGPLADRALRFAEEIADRLGRDRVPPCRLLIRRAAPEHVGLGTGTQLGLAVSSLLAALAGLPEASGPVLAEWAGRGRRSGIGLQGFDRGGLIVDGGRRVDEGVPPLIAHHPFPDDWRVLVVLPEARPGLHGGDEVEAFRRLPPWAATLTDRLCRLVLLGILPAVAEQNLPAFGAALEELQHCVGLGFAPVQGGPYSGRYAGEIVNRLREHGLQGVGQSSWGPALYAFDLAEEARQRQVLQWLRDRFGLDETSAFWTRASRFGAVRNRIGANP